MVYNQLVLGKERMNFPIFIRVTVKLIIPEPVIHHLNRFMTIYFAH